MTTRISTPLSTPSTEAPATAILTSETTDFAKHVSNALLEQTNNVGEIAGHVLFLMGNLKVLDEASELIIFAFRKIIEWGGENLAIGQKPMNESEKRQRALLKVLVEIKIAEKASTIHSLEKFQEYFKNCKQTENWPKLDLYDAFAKTYNQNPVQIKEEGGEQLIPINLPLWKEGEDIKPTDVNQVITRIIKELNTQINQIKKEAGVHPEDLAHLTLVEKTRLAAERMVYAFGATVLGALMKAAANYIFSREFIIQANQTLSNKALSEAREVSTAIKAIASLAAILNFGGIALNYFGSMVVQTQIIKTAQWVVYFGSNILNFGFEEGVNKSIADSHQKEVEDPSSRVKAIAWSTGILAAGILIQNLAHLATQVRIYDWINQATKNIPKTA